MDEVSWKVFQFYVEYLQRKGISGDLLVEGLPRGAALLAHERKWYDWDEHVVVVERFAKLCGGADAAEAAAGDSVTESWTRPLRALARRLATPRHIYWAGTRVFAPYLYRHLSFAQEDLPDGRLRLTIEMPPEYTPCELVFRMWRGAYRRAPRMLGLPDAHVEAEIGPHRGVYLITLPANKSLPHIALTRARALLDRQQLVEQLGAHQMQLRETYEALARAYEDFREIVQASPDAVLIHRSGRISYANATAATALGERSPAALTGRDLLEWIAPDDRARAAASLFAAPTAPSGAAPPDRAADASRSFELTVVPSGGGEPRVLDARACGPILFERKPASVLLARDVTARRRDEVALLASERTQRALLDAMPDLILRVTRDGVVTRLEGARHHALREHLAAIARLAPAPEGTDPAAAPWTARALDHVRRAFGGARDLVFQFELGDGPATRHCECRTVATDPQSAICLIRDITSERHLEQQLRVAERMASLGTLAAGVAHEINNPLAYVQANLERLEAAIEGGATERADLLEATRAALHGATRIRDIVRGVRAFTRPDTTELDPVDVNAVVDATLRVVGGSLRHRARVVQELGVDVVARTNEGQLEQVLVNLLVNAAQALPEHRRAENRVWLRTVRRADDTVAIEVRDNGPGIPYDVQKRIFDPFFTTKAVGSGTGLGLSISHRIVSQLRGSLTVESAPGAGATFTVVLPAAERPVAPSPSAAPKGPCGPGSVRVLVVDDEVLITKALRLLLHDCNVTVANGGEEALRQLAAQRFDVVLCDVMMPEVGGVEVYQRIATRDPSQAARFVFMTGNAFAHATTQLSSMEGHVLEKPFTEATLRGAIQRVIEAAGKDAPAA